MKIKKKTYSLVTKEIVNVVRSLLFGIVVVVILVNPELIREKQALMIPLWAFIIIPVVFNFFAKYDIQDEAAIEHYDKAKKKVLNFIWWGLALTIIAGAFYLALGVKMRPETIFSFNINYWHFLIAFELIDVAISVLFIYYEKREA